MLATKISFFDMAFHVPANNEWKSATGMRKERLYTGQALNQHDLYGLRIVLYITSVFQECRDPSSIFRGYLVPTVALQTAEFYCRQNPLYRHPALQGFGVQNKVFLSWLSLLLPRGWW